MFRIAAVEQGSNAALQVGAEFRFEAVRGFVLRFCQIGSTMAR